MSSEDQPNATYPTKSEAAKINDLLNAASAALRKASIAMTDAGIGAGTEPKRALNQIRDALDSLDARVMLVTVPGVEKVGQ